MKAGYHFSGCWGGAIHCDKYSVCVISDTRFVQNYSHRGGALYSGNSQIIISRCDFDTNSTVNDASNYGGAINLRYNSRCTIEDSTFAYNRGAGASSHGC